MTMKAVDDNTKSIYNIIKIIIIIINFICLTAEFVKFYSGKLWALYL